MRFSIRLLMLLVFLIAIILAAMVSERPGRKYKRIASIEFFPAGDQIAVNVLEKNGYLPKEPCVFHRTINVVNYPSLETESVVRRDMFRCETPSNALFWHSQTDVIPTETHLVFLNQDRSSLMLQDLESGELKEWARYDGGEIWSFCASADARLISVSGRHAPPDPAGEAVTLEGETNYLGLDSGLEMIKENENSFSLLGFVSNLGIDEKELITTPLEYRDEDRLQVLVHRALVDLAKMPSIPRFLIVPRDEAKPFDSDTIGNAFSSFFFEFDPVSLDPIGIVNSRPNRSSRPNHNVRLAPLYDIATSQGSCRFASVIESNRLILNIITDKIPSTDNIDFYIRCLADAESVVALSKTGDLVAVSHGQDVRVFDVSDLIRTIDQKQFGRIAVLHNLSSLFELENETLVTAVAFSPDGKFLVTGDDKGFISMFDVASGELAKREQTSGRMRGLPRLLLFPMVAVWLVLAVVMYVRRGVDIHEFEVSKSGVLFWNGGFVSKELKEYVEED